MSRNDRPLHEAHECLEGARYTCRRASAITRVVIDSPFALPGCERQQTGLSLSRSGSDRRRLPKPAIRTPPEGVACVPWKPPDVDAQSGKRPAAASADRQPTRLTHQRQSGV